MDFDEKYMYILNAIKVVEESCIEYFKFVFARAHALSPQSHLGDQSFRRLTSEERLTGVEDQWSEGTSGKRSSRRQTIGPSVPRNHEEFQRSNATSSGRRSSCEDRSFKADPRLDRVQNGNHRDRQRRSTGEEPFERRANKVPERTRVTSSSDDHFERLENSVMRRTSSLRRDAALDDLERSSSVRRDSRRSSLESDVRSWESSSRDPTSPRRTSEERARPLEAQSPRRDTTKGDRGERRDGVESRSSRRGQRARDASRDRGTLASRGSSQHRDIPDDPERGSVKRSAGRSSLESDGQATRKTPSKEMPTRRRDDNEDLPKSIGELHVTERRRSTEKDRQQQQQQPKNATRKRQEVRRSRSQEEPKTTAGTDAVESAMEIPKEEWACEHCTFINKINDRVCVVCCKTKTSALPPPSAHDDHRQLPKARDESSGVGGQTDPEKTIANLSKVSNGNESGDSGSVKSKGRPKRKISFSFGTKLSK